MKCSVAAIVSGMLAVCAMAVTPVTPRLEPATHKELLAALGQAGLPEVAQNSVVLAITRALGFEPGSRSIDDPSSYQHLPSVRGQATPVSGQCAEVQLRAWLPADTVAGGLVVEGTYCLVGLAEWRAERQSVAKSRG